MIIGYKDNLPLLLQSPGSPSRRRGTQSSFSSTQGRSQLQEHAGVQSLIVVNAVCLFSVQLHHVRDDDDVVGGDDIDVRGDGSGDDVGDSDDARISLTKHTIVLTTSS